MAVTTGTTWDIVLSNDAVATRSTSASTVSARAAYQAALYGRAQIVDLRSAHLRTASGELPDELGAAVVHPRELGRWLRESLASRVLLLDDDDDGDRSGRLVADGAPLVASIDGGFAAWRAAGLPV